MAENGSYDTLHKALIEEDTDKRIQALRHLVEKGTDINCHNPDGRTALMTAAHGGYVECVRVLLDAGANVNDADTGGKTSLWLALYNRHAECVKVLLETGANVNDANKGGQTLLWLASYNGHAECVKVLLEAGADVNMAIKGGHTSLMTAAHDGYVECARLLVDAGANLNHSDIFGVTALMLASFSNNASQCVKLLLEVGAGVNDTDKGGQTALMKAVIYGHLECVKLLLEAGADVNQSDMYGETALIHCLTNYTYGNNSEACCLKLLVNAGADIDARKNIDLQPIHFALRLWPDFKFPAEYLMSENWTLSQVSYDKIHASMYRDFIMEEEVKLDILKLLFDCGLPRHLCQSFIVEQETSVRKWVETVASQPNTLKSICIFKIRRSIGLSIKSKVTKLNLPIVIQDMILLKGILSLECFD